MDRKQMKSSKGKPRQSVVAAGLAMVLAAVSFRTFRSGKTGGGPSPVAAAEAMSEGAAAPSANSYPPVTIDWPQDFSRDLFDVRVVMPPTPRPTTAPATKPVEQPVVIIDEAAVAAADARAQVVLTATMVGASPQAIINGQVHRVGEVIAGFRIVQIEQHRIIVERRGIRLAITNR